MPGDARRENHRPPACDAQQIGAHNRFALRIERAGSLVEDQDPRVVDQRPCDRKPLALSARQVGRTLFDVGLISVGHAFDEFFGTREPCRLHRIRERQAGTPGNDVVPYRTAEQEVVLQHHAEVLSQMAQVDIAQIGSVDLQEAAVISIDSL